VRHDYFVTSFRISQHKGTLKRLLLLRAWCRKYGVSLNAMLNSTVIELSEQLVPYEYEDINSEIYIKIPVPQSKKRYDSQPN
jgi:hypothetical protein